MSEIEQTLTSIEVAEMVDKEHSKLLRDIRRYEKQFAEAKIGLGDFFKESFYKDVNNQERPCYRITKKGCEFIAHKLTGAKGTIFTVRYINRFHEMEDILKDQQEEQMPWFIRELGKEGKVMLFRDFKAITGVELCSEYTAWERPDKLIGGREWNAWTWDDDKEKFKREYGFDFGDGDIMGYLYLRGIKRAIRVIERDEKNQKKLTAETKKMILDGLESVEGKREVLISKPKQIESARQNPIQICININGNEVSCK